jgi:hypothetical protein
MEYNTHKASSAFQLNCNGVMTKGFPESKVDYLTSLSLLRLHNVHMLINECGAACGKETGRRNRITLSTTNAT